MSESERKSSARAAYQEGIALQDQGRAADALARFEAAEKLFDAPTHLLHIAECQALAGKLVEASETYETLSRRNLGDSPPEAFVQAQQQGQAELAVLRPRIPTLRMTVRPDATTIQNLQVSVNGAQIPRELLGIARPINPGIYRATAAAPGYAAVPQPDVPIVERDQKTIEIVLRPQANAPLPIAYAPNGPPPGTVAPTPAPYADGPGDAGKKGAPTGATSSPVGLLVGARGGVFVPGGGTITTAGSTGTISDVAGAGGGGGIDAYLRVAKMLLLGGSAEVAKLSANKDALATGSSRDIVTTYVGAAIGILPNVDKVSFIGDLGLGYRALKQSDTSSGGPATKLNVSGLNVSFGAGLSIPAGPFRIVPKASFNLAQFSNIETCNDGECEKTPVTDGSYTLLYVGLGFFYHADLGKKPTPPVTASLPPNR